MILKSFWRIVVIHDFRERPFYFLTLGLKQCSNIYIFLKTVFLNYLFVLLYFLLYSVFNEHLHFRRKALLFLLWKASGFPGGLKWTRTIDLALIRRAL